MSMTEFIKLTKYLFKLFCNSDINKSLRPGPHHDPPTRKEVQKYLKVNAPFSIYNCVISQIDIGLPARAKSISRVDSSL